MNPVRRVRTAIFLLFAASFPAAAQHGAPEPAPEPAAEPTAASTPSTGTPAESAITAPVASPVSESVPEVTSVPGVTDPAKKGAPWRGSAVSYGHATTAISLRRDAEPLYNPIWYHQLSLRPEWHFGSQLFLRARIDLAQEFTASDVTTRRNEVEWSDLSLDVGATGWEDPFAKVKFAGTLRLIGGLSRNSAAETKIMSVGPGVSVSRKFPVLSGITVRYDARYTQRFHRFTTRQNAGPSISAACFDPGAIECSVLSQEPVRNIRADLSHGPSLSFSPLEKVSLSAQFQMFRGWLYRLPPSELDAQVANPLPDNATRDLWGFNLGVNYQVLPELDVGIASNTYAAQLSPDSTRRSPFFNRFTTVGLDVTLDVESLVSRF